MHSLTGFQRDLLIVLNSMDSPNGQEIKAELEASQERTIRHARLYSNLDALVDEGFVEKEARDGRTNEYSPTQKGRRESRARFEWEEQYLSDSSQQAV